jgi:hypothetical protein
MAPLIVLVVSVVAFWLAGRAGVAAFQDPSLVLRAALGDHVPFHRVRSLG